MAEGTGRSPILLVTAWNGRWPVAGDWLLPPSGIYAYRIDQVVGTGDRRHPVALTVTRDWRDQIPPDATSHAWEWKQRRSW